MKPQRQSFHHAPAGLAGSPPAAGPSPAGPPIEPAMDLEGELHDNQDGWRLFGLVIVLCSVVMVCGGLIYLVRILAY